MQSGLGRRDVVCGCSSRGGVMHGAMNIVYEHLVS